VKRLTLLWRIIRCGLVLLTTLCASAGPTTSGQPSTSPSTISFGSIPIDPTDRQSERLTNSGGSTVLQAAPVPTDRAVSKDSSRLRRGE
jgi:hypothetical protein